MSQVHAESQASVREVSAGRSRERLILFTRFPVAGRTKTRLTPALGAERAAALQRRLTLAALRSAEAIVAARGLELEILFDGANERMLSHWLGDRFTLHAQADGALGDRMFSGFTRAFGNGCEAVVIIGADCPELSPEILNEAFDRLRNHEVVIGPATDGGYYLIGLRRAVPELFSGPSWGTSTVLGDSLQIVKRLGLSHCLLSPLSDIDRPEDLTVWQRLCDGQESGLGKVSVIIPALNEGERIAATLQAAVNGHPHEVIVVDGGSKDGTAECGRGAGATVLLSGPGRARQMNAGASRAAGNVLLFLHADTIVPPNWPRSVSLALSQPGVSAGAFQFALSKPFAGRRIIEFTTNLRSRICQMPYGDQGLFVRRSIFEELGGFANMPILEDYELVQRLRRRGRIVTLKESILTSARRWQRLGVLRTTLLNKWMILGYRLGWPIEKLASTYGNAGKR